MECGDCGAKQSYDRHNLIRGQPWCTRPLQLPYKDFTNKKFISLVLQIGISLTWSRQSQPENPDIMEDVSSPLLFTVYWISNSGQQSGTVPQNTQLRSMFFLLAASLTPGLDELLWQYHSNSFILLLFCEYFFNHWSIADVSYRYVPVCRTK